MSTLTHYPSLLDANCVLKLKERNIKSVLDFLYETPESISNITKLHFQDVLEIRKKMIDTFRKKPVNGLELYEDMKNHYCNFSTGMVCIDGLIGGLESGRVYEICGLSGSGKTQICLSIACHVSSIGKCVNFIDTKNDFSASRVRQMFSKKRVPNKDIMHCMERIKVKKVYNMEELVDILHYLKNLFSVCHMPLIIIDCVSTCFFSSGIGANNNLGFAFLNHIASLMKYIVRVHHSIIIVTNLATKYFSSEGTSIEKSIKPCLGTYWQQVSNVRLDVRKENSSTFSVSLEKDNNSLVKGSCQVDLTIL